MNISALISFFDEMEKIAKKDRNARYSETATSWSSGRRAQRRARAGLDKYHSGILPHSSKYRRAVDREKLNKGLYGAGMGLGTGAVLRSLAEHKSGSGKLGTLTAGVLGGVSGTLMGAGLGTVTGMYTGDKKYLKRQGIRPTWGGFGRGEFTPEAAKRYLAKEDIRKK